MCNRYSLFLLAALAWGQNQQTSPLVVLPFQATPVTGGDIRILSPNYTDYGEILSTANAFEIIGKQTTNGNITLMPGNVAGGNLASIIAIGPRSDTPTFQSISGYSPFNRINLQDLSITALNPTNTVWNLSTSAGVGVLSLADGSGSGGLGSGIYIQCTGSVGGFCAAPAYIAETVSASTAKTTIDQTHIEIQNTPGSTNIITINSYTIANTLGQNIDAIGLDGSGNGNIQLNNHLAIVNDVLGSDTNNLGNIVIFGAANAVTFSASSLAANGNPGAIVNPTLYVTGPTSGSLPGVWVTGGGTAGAIAVYASTTQTVSIGSKVGGGYLEAVGGGGTVALATLGSFGTAGDGGLVINTHLAAPIYDVGYSSITGVSSAVLSDPTSGNPIASLAYSTILTGGQLTLLTTTGTTLFDTSVGATHTATVRNSAGTGTCTLIFQYGLYTGGTC